MDFKKHLFTLTYLLVAISLESGCSECEPDRYGPNVTMILPVVTEISMDTLIVGDTISIQLTFPKEIKIKNNDQNILLENFNFFTELNISEISGLEEDFNLDIDIFEIIGEVDFLPLTTAAVYPITYLESENFYSFEADIVFNESGKYFLAMGTNVGNYEFYEHPFVYQCEDKRRVRIEIEYQSSETNEREFQDIFLTSPIEYLSTVYDYERFSSIGGRAFVVIE
ncbi:hypothetical protein CEQ90_04550 [Lewinellaceae bacterium SD302]|nr:hypothetical protein CEQ90_04550 [Lewinellaceae bacterium SD302]